jgi:superfamily II DNA or RNA helicase
MDDILDFLPIYPDINDDAFNQQIYKKKEFFDNKLESFEKIPDKKGGLLKNQIIMSYFFSSYTLYDQLLLYHTMGSGKTCTSIACIEQIRSENSTFRGAIIFAKGNLLLSNYKRELLYKCTNGKYINKRSKNKLSTALVKDYYSFKTFQTFSNFIKNKTDEFIINEYSKYIIVIDEVHNIRQDDDKMLYKQFHRFLHLIQNSKILLMSGTPIKDKIDEIADIMNLMLPIGKQLPIKEKFLSKYFDETENFDNDILYKLKDDTSLVNDLKSKFRGRVSYLQSVKSSIKKEFVGESNYKTLKNIVVVPTIMSDHQTKGYAKAYKDEDIEKEEEDDEDEKKENPKPPEDGANADSFDINSTRASIFVFPDESYGITGFKKYISGDSIKNYKLSSKFVEFLKKKENEDDTEEDTLLKNIGKCSSKYEHVIKKILKSVRDPVNKKCMFLYNNTVKGGGVILFSLLLKLFNFKQANLSAGKTKDLRFILITTENAKDSKYIIDNIFNDKKNVHGDYISLIIGSRIVSEGFSFNHIQEEYIITPYWNYSEIDQAIARGLRFGSHNFLIEDFKDNNLDITPSVKIYQYVSIPNSDKIDSVDIKHYKKSEIKDINSKMIERLIKESAFDCALNKKRNTVTGYDNERECEYQSCDYVCDNVLNIIPENLDYSTDKIYYLKNEENQKFKNKIFDIFKTQFYITMSDLDKYEKSDYIFLFLKEIIDNKEIIYNKYGIPCFLYEDNNIFYISDNANISNNFLSSYYTEMPNIYKKPPSIITKSIQETSNLSEQTIIKIFNETDPKIVRELIISLKPNIVEMIFEQLISSNQNRGIIYNFLKIFCLETDNGLISWILYDIKKKNNKDLKFFSYETSSWIDCGNEQIKIFDNYINEIRDNEYKYFGFYVIDKENKNNLWKFLLVDDSQNIKEKKEKKIKEPKTKPKKKKPEIVEDNIDKRTINTGKACKSYNKLILSEIIVNTFKIIPEEDDKNWKKLDKDIEELIKEYSKIKVLDKFFKENKTEDEMKHMIYWYTNHSSNELCFHISKFLDDNGLTRYFFTSS